MAMIEDILTSEAMLAASTAAGATAIRAQEPLLVAEIDDAALSTFGFDARQLEIARSLAPRSYVMSRSSRGAKSSARSASSQPSRAGRTETTT